MNAALLQSERLKPTLIPKGSEATPTQDRRAWLDVMSRDVVDGVAATDR